MTKPKPKIPRPQVRCALCGQGHNRRGTPYCGAPCRPCVAAAVALIRQAPRGWDELVHDLATADKPYRVAKYRLKQDLAPLIKRKLLYKTRAEGTASPTVLHIRPHNDDAIRRAAKLKEVRGNRIAQSNRDRSKRKPSNPRA